MRKGSRKEGRKEGAGKILEEERTLNERRKTEKTRRNARRAVRQAGKGLGRQDRERTGKAGRTWTSSPPSSKDAVSSSGVDGVPLCRLGSTSSVSVSVSTAGSALTSLLALALLRLFFQSPASMPFQSMRGK